MPRKTLRQHELEGTYRRDRHEAWRHPPWPGVPQPMDFLTVAQLKLWKKVVAAAPPGLLAGADGGLVASFSVLLDVLDRANRALDGSDSPQARALILQVADGLLRVERQMGFTPVSRRRLTVDW